MKKTEIKKLDKEWSLQIRSLGHCEYCGKQGDECQLHPHHYVGRRNRATRWYLPNGICLCASHHTLAVKSAHGDPEWFRGEMLKLRGKDWLNEIVAQSNKIFKGTFEQVQSHLEGDNNYL